MVLAMDGRARPLRAQNRAVPPVLVALLPLYRAVNRTSEKVTGTATFNVTPFKAGIYFNKLQCFCFTKQRLAPGESADLSVSFFVDADILTDPNTRDVDTITLSYTMFRAKEEGPPEQDSR